MGAKLDRVCLVDVESTCWASRDEQGSKPNEIIEIGICTLNINTGIIDNANGYIVKPRFTSVSQFCTKLTGWTQQDVNGGKDIKEVIQTIFREYALTKDHVWFSCGEYDRVKLGCGEHGSLKSLYGIDRYSNLFDQMRHVNIKTLFALKHKLPREKGMEGMLAMINEPLVGRHHNGKDDAMNIAKIVRHVLN